MTAMTGHVAADRVSVTSRGYNIMTRSAQDFLQLYPHLFNTLAVKMTKIYLMNSLIEKV